MTLLFVEDEFYTRQGIVSSIDWLSLGVDRLESVTDGKSGMEQLSLRPDILLTDIRMPYFTGLELAEKAKLQDPHCEIIIMSSYSDKAYLFQAISLSTVAYIEKPVDLRALSAAIVRAVERRKRSQLIDTFQGGTQPAALGALPDPAGEAYSHTTKIALGYLAEHYADPDLSLEAVARHVHLNSAYLSGSFKKDTGRNLKRVIIDVRMEKAAALLLDTSLSVTNIAARTGYRNANYFSKLFHKETGFTPHAYRAAGGKAE